MKLVFDLANFHLVQIIVFGCLFIGVYFFTLYDNGDSIKTATSGVRTNITQVEGQILNKQKEIENVKIFKREFLKDEKEIKYLLNFIPPSLTFTDVTTLLINEAKSAGINIGLKRDSKSDKEEDSEYRTLNIQLTVNGSFSQILLFLSKLTAQKRILIVNKINIKADRASRLVEAQLDISTYRYEKKEESESAEKGQKAKS